jgi:Domain of unknown function (DUF4148)
MKFAPSVFTLALISAFAVTASAQTAASAPSRADVKAETAAAKKSGTLPMDAGPDSTKAQSMPKKPKTEANRAAVKDDTKAAAKAGTIPSGQESVAGQDMPKKPKSEADRAAVKSEAAAANKAGTIPSGQESVVGQDKGAASAPKKK